MGVLVTRVTIIFVSLLVFSFFSGCAGLGSPGGNATAANASNITDAGNLSANVTGPANLTNLTNQTVLPPSWPRHNGSLSADAILLSFEYPPNMAFESGRGIFTGKHDLADKTGEALIVIYTNASQEYGQNKDELFKTNPTKAASDLLLQDRQDDPAGLLDSAQSSSSASNLTTFSLARDAYVAELPFTIRFSGFETAYTGYALSMYVPERSLHVRVRILAVDPTVAKDIRDHFLISFRLG